jgi:DNA-binding NtrC family response regulator
MSSTPADGAPSGAVTSPRQPHVLVVEPNWAVQRLFRLALGELAVRLTIASGTSEARAIIASESVDFAYIDVSFGDEENCQGVADSAAALGIPVVLMTGDPSGMQLAAMARHSLLQKPFRLQDMFRHLILNLSESWT